MVSAAVLTGFVIVAGNDLVRALHLIPTGSFFGDMVGSRTLPGGLAELSGAEPWFRTTVHVGLIAGALLVGLRWGAGPDIARDMERLTCPEQTFLMAGILLVLGFFFTAQNIGYRVTHLVLTLPALTALWHVGCRRGLYAAATLLALALLWAEGWRGASLAVATNADPAIAGLVLLPTWLLREAMWWCLVSIYIGLLTALMLRSTMVRAVWPARATG